MTVHKIITAAFALLLSQPLLAMTVVEKDFVCPIGGEVFTQTVPASGTTFGKRTDLKPLGPISAPWTIPQCPTNKFVIFKEDFTPEELETYKNIVESAEYQEIDHDSSEYYYLAKLLEGNEDRLENIAWAYLQASWEMDERNVREQALTNFKNSLAEIDQTGDISESIEQDIITHNLLIGELNRLLGNFEVAKAQFETLKMNPMYIKTPFIANYIDQELQLIAERNANPETINQPKK